MIYAGDVLKIDVKLAVACCMCTMGSEGFTANICACVDTHALNSYLVVLVSTNLRNV